MTAKTTRTRTLCNVCGTRTVGSGGRQYDTQSASSLGLCGYCYEEAGWENTHSDWGHDANSETVVEGDGEDENGHRVKGCWICFPELNMAQKPHTPRKASATGERKVGTRRPQLNHRTQCTHPQTPEDRRECRKAFWAEEARKAEEAAKEAATQNTKAQATRRTRKATR